MADDEYRAKIDAHAAKMFARLKAHATPEPVGEPFGWWFTEDPEVFSMPGSGFRRYPNKPQHTVECIPLYTRPAPGVPEGFALVPVKATPKIAMTLYEGARNCFSPKVAEGLWQDALAAAQAKGGER